MTQTLHATVQRGKEFGLLLTPHRYADGCYVASHERFERAYRRVTQLSELIALYRQGYKIRMSAPASRHHKSPSLIATASIELVG